MKPIGAHNMKLKALVNESIPNTLAPLVMPLVKRVEHRIANVHTTDHGHLRTIRSLLLHVVERPADVEDVGQLRIALDHVDRILPPNGDGGSDVVLQRVIHELSKAFTSQSGVA
jgi:hypothetical protein